MERGGESEAGSGGRIVLGNNPFRCSPKPIKIFVNYCWIIGEIDKRLGKCPDNVKDVLIDLDIQQNEELKE